MIDRWGVREFADVIRVHGQSAERAYLLATTMRYRNSVRSDYWMAILSDAKARGWDDITLELMASLKRGRACHPSVVGNVKKHRPTADFAVA